MGGTRATRKKKKEFFLATIGQPPYADFNVRVCEKHLKKIDKEYKITACRTLQENVCEVCESKKDSTVKL